MFPLLIFYNIKVQSYVIIFFFLLIAKKSLKIFVKTFRRKLWKKSKFLEAIFSFIRSYVCSNYLLRARSNSCVTTCRWRIYRVSRFDIEKLFVDFNVESYCDVEKEVWQALTRIIILKNVIYHHVIIV